MFNINFMDGKIKTIRINCGVFSASQWASGSLAHKAVKANTTI